MDFFKKRSQEEKKKQDKKTEYFKKDMTYNTYRLKLAFRYPVNNSLKLRELILPFPDQKKATILFVEGTVETAMINEHIIHSLLKEPDIPIEEGQLIPTIISRVLTTTNATTVNNIEDAITNLVNGNTLIILEEEDQAISVETTGFENRSPGPPTTEPGVKGSKVGFIESVAVNRSLIRKHIKDSHLMCEAVLVGKRTPQEISVMYLDGIADKKLVDTVKKRLSAISRDGVLDLSLVEQLIEERPFSVLPSTMTTERPDRTAYFLQEGHIILLMEGSPLALIVPITFWSLFHTSEDQYYRWAFGNMLRIVRIIALLLALFTPALYIAVTTYHSEMFPTDLLLAIAATREQVPIPAILELLFMLFTFEILREAGVRIPTQIGPTIGIVGALILGQAAVDANVVSPILVVVVAITGLASFAIPDVSLNMTIRILCFINVLAANFAGILGIAVFTVLTITYANSYKSFGVPFFSPFAPYFPSSNDLLTRPPLFKQWIRPFSTSPSDKVRADQPEGKSKQ